MLKQIFFVVFICVIIILAIVYQAKAEELPAEIARIERATKGKSKEPIELRIATKSPLQKSNCRYTKTKWSACDSSTNQRTRTLEVKPSSPTVCQHRKVEKKNCKRACRYTKGEWTQCVVVLNQRTRTDVLRPGSTATCDLQKIITKKCAKPCKYSPGDWSDCKDNVRTRVRQLLTGDPKVCQPSKTTTKPCLNKKGQSRCFYDAWSDWSACENGVQKKTRRVVAGEQRCHDVKRTVKTKTCKSKA